MNKKAEDQVLFAAQSRRSLETYLQLTVATGVLAGIGSVVGLIMSHRIYGQETTDFFNASIAQDLVNLFIVVPLMLMLVARTHRGSIKSWLCLNGFLAFTVYNYAIYAFSIHFGPLFLLWVAVLGLSSFALLGSLFALVNKSGLSDHFAGNRVRFPGWLLITVGLLFVLLWLSEIVPDLMAGRPSTSALLWKVPTNPVHVLDLALFLPAVLYTGVSLLRRGQVGIIGAAGFLLFLTLTCLPIVVTPFVVAHRGGHPTWSVIPPIALIATLALSALWQFFRGVERELAIAP